MTQRYGVFAAGDVLTGPATVIDAIASGHRAAESIRHFLEEGRPGIREQRPERRAPLEFGIPDAPPVPADRVRPELELPVPGREFAEVERAFAVDDAVEEARRCLRCGPCGECQVCAPTCQRRHFMVRVRDDDVEPSATTAIVRAPGSVVMALPERGTTSGWLLSESRPGILPEIETSRGTPVEILPVRAHVHAEACRGCGRCAEICPFDAVELCLGSGSELHARVEPSLCRGCNLCTAVCPTRAALPSALSHEWWGSHLEDAFRPKEIDEGAPGPVVVLACQRRAGALDAAFARGTRRVEIIRFRCVGQVDAGMLLELRRLGADRIVVAGCREDRCRFGTGAGIAREEIDRARAMLDLLAGEGARIVCDWSGDRAHDPLDSPLDRVLREGG
jgi:ferredoxin